MLQLAAHHLHTGGGGQLGQLVEVLFDEEGGLAAQRHADEQRATVGGEGAVGAGGVAIQ